MHVRMKAFISGTRDGRDWPQAGSELDVSDDEGASLCAAGLATPVAKKDAKIEKAVVDDDTTEERSPGLMTEDVTKRRGRPPGSKNRPKA